MATDPVCGMQVDERSAAGSSVIEGKAHFFCSIGCKTKFDANPSAYLGPGAGTGVAGHSGYSHHQEPVQPGATYTCPMHPEIERKAPGDCPKCGMALVPVAGTGATDDTELHDLKRRLWIGSALSLPLFLLAMAPMVGIHELFGLQPKVRGLLLPPLCNRAPSIPARCIPKSSAMRPAIARSAAWRWCPLPAPGRPTTPNCMT